MKSKLVLYVLLLSIIPCQMFAQATNAWLTNTNGNWNDPTRWSLGRAPISTDSVVIAASGTYTVTMNVNATVQSLTIGGSGGTPTLITSGRALTVNNRCQIESNGILTINSASTMGGLGALVNNGRVNLTGSFVTASYTNNGTLEVRQASSITGNFTTSTNSVVQIIGDGTNASLTVSNGFTNRGSIELMSQNCCGSLDSRLFVTNGTLVNEVGASILSTGEYGLRELNAQLDNRGTVTINYPLTINRSASAHRNSGTISLGSSNLTINQSGANASFTNLNTGSLIIPSGRELFINGGRTELIGNNSVSGILTFNASAVIGNANIPVGAVLNIRGSTLGVAGDTIVNNGTIVVRNSAVANGFLRPETNSVIRIIGDGTNASLTVSNGFTNRGSIELMSQNCCGSLDSRLFVTNGTLVNEVGASILSTGEYGLRELNAQLDNRGTVTINYPLTINRSASAHRNSGTISLNNANLTLTQSGTNASFTNEGIVSIPSSRTMTATGGIVMNFPTGAFQGGGVLNVTGTTFGNAGLIGVTVLGTILPLPTFSLSTPSGVSPTGITLNGVVNPNGASASVQFEFGLTPSYGQLTAVQNFSGTSLQLASATLSGLQPNTTYNYRLTVTSGSFTLRSQNQSFTTSTVGVSVSTFATGFSNPLGIGFDQAGFLYVANNGNNTLSRVSPSGVTSLFAFGFNSPLGVAVSQTGDIYVANDVGGTISKVSPSGAVSVFSTGYDRPSGLAFDASGTLHVANLGSGVIHRVDGSGNKTIVASGLSNPWGLAFGANGDLFVANNALGNNTISRVTPSGVVSLFASGLTRPAGLVFDRNGNLYVANTEGTTISRITPNGVATTFASELNAPFGLAIDANGNLYVSNAQSNTISRITPPSVETPTGFSAFNIRPDRVTMFWRGSTPEYQITQNGNPIYTGSQTAFVAQGLSPNTSYTFALRGRSGSTLSQNAISISLTTPLALGFVPNQVVAVGVTGEFATGSGTTPFEIDSTGVTLQFPNGVTTNTAFVVTKQTGEAGGTLPLGLTNISQDAFWTVTPTAGSAVGTYNITLDTRGITNILRFNELSVLKRDNSQSPWQSINPSQITYNNPFITVSGLTSFSDFAIGGENQLPVALVEFTAQARNSSVILSWKTATELNNQGFDIERKSANQDWLSVGFTRGNGTTNSPQTYSFTDNNVSGKNFYRLKQIDFDGTFEYSPTVEVLVGAPTQFVLEQNYPNPFNPSTKIAYRLPKTEKVKLAVYDALGREVAVLVNTEKPAGTYEATFDASTLSSGVYFYKLQAGAFSETKKMLLLK